MSEHVEENAFRSRNVVLNTLWEEINNDHEDSEQKMLRSEKNIILYSENCSAAGVLA